MTTLDICECRYWSIPSISGFDTGYTACWKWEIKRNNHLQELMNIPPLRYWFFLSAFSFLLPLPFFLFILSFFSFFILRQKWRSYSISDAIVDNYLIGIRTVVKCQRLSVSAAVVPCSLSTAEYHRGYTKYFRWSILLILSTTEYFRGMYTPYS